MRVPLLLQFALAGLSLAIGSDLRAGGPDAIPRSNDSGRHSLRINDDAHRRARHRLWRPAMSRSASPLIEAGA